MAVDSDEPVIGNCEVKKLEDPVRELERILGRKTLENKIVREALSKARSKNRYRCLWLMKAVYGFAQLLFCPPSASASPLLS